MIVTTGRPIYSGPEEKRHRQQQRVQQRKRWNGVLSAGPEEAERRRAVDAYLDNLVRTKLGIQRR